MQMFVWECRYVDQASAFYYGKEICQTSGILSESLAKEEKEHMMF